MAICGNLDIPGGNIQANEPPILKLGKFVRAESIPSKKSDMIHAFHQALPKLMTVPPSYFKRAVMDGYPYAVTAAYFQGANPLIAYADSRQTSNALRKLEFLAVSDIFMTPTAALADVVLPAATQFEFNDIGHYGLGHGHILARPKVVDPPGECWPDIKILNELGKRITPSHEWFDDTEELLSLVLAPSGLSFSQFCRQGILKGSDKFQKYLTSGFRTSSGKVELCLKHLENFSLPPLAKLEPLDGEKAEYPLVLTSCKSRYYLHSSYRWVETLRKHHPRPQALVHPETAARYAIRENEPIVIETETGRIEQVARLTARVHPGVVCADYGWWFPEEPEAQGFGWDRSNYNLLTSIENLGREFGTPRLKGLACRIRPKKNGET
jgi:anaerobic selenocysteine-containing dehydrogenase